MMKRIVAYALLTVVIAAGVAEETAAQSLDQKAWNAVWDRLEKLLERGGSTEDVVHVLEFPVPATWVDRQEENLRQLQQVAGIVPGEVFSIDPAMKDLRLHQLYYAIVGDLSFPDLDPASQRALDRATGDWHRVFGEYLEVLDRYRLRWRKHVKEREQMGEPVDSLARLRFRQQMAGMFVQVQHRLDASAAEIQRYAPVARQWADAVRRLTTAVTGAKSDLTGLWLYEGDFAAAASIGEDCAPDGPGWEVLTFGRTIESEKLRSSGWNARGGFGGGFFSIRGSGGGSNYEKTIESEQESVSLRFCKLTYLNLGPGDWFDMSLLQAIDQGLMPFKAESPQGRRKVLGPGGLIPRLVKGVIIARSIALEAHLSESKLEEMRRRIGGSGGVRIGPIRIGGRGSSSKFEREYKTANGGYGRSTAFDVPVVLAVVTEPTGNPVDVDVAALQPGSEVADTTAGVTP